MSVRKREGVATTNHALGLRDREGPAPAGLAELAETGRLGVKKSAFSCCELQSRPGGRPSIYDSNPPLNLLRHPAGEKFGLSGGRRSVGAGF